MSREHKLSILKDLKHKKNKNKKTNHVKKATYRHNWIKVRHENEIENLIILCAHTYIKTDLINSQKIHSHDANNTRM